MKIIADNLQIMNPQVKQALEGMDPGLLQTLVRKIASIGPDLIDINPGPLGQNWRQKLDFLLTTVQEATTLPLCLDSNNPQLLKQALELTKGQERVLNGFSLEEYKLKTILPLAVEYKIPSIAFLLSPGSKVPANLEERLALCNELLEICTQAQMDLDLLIIDPVLPPLTWEDGSKHARAVLETIKLLPEIAGRPIKTIVGLSNLTSGIGNTKAKYFLEATYLALLCQAELDYCLMNVFHPQAMQVVNFYHHLQSGHIICAEEFGPSI